MDETSPNPGSAEAIKVGCTCSVLDNHHGQGYHKQPGIFVFTSGCPVHWPVGTDLGPFKAAISNRRA
jgi:hypothetical protein